MADTTRSRKPWVTAGRVQAIVAVVVLLCAAAATYAGFVAQGAQTCSRIDRLEVDYRATDVKLDDVRDSMIKFGVEQSAQRVTLNRIDETLRDLAKPK